jgi:hypothetical protein
MKEKRVTKQKQSKRRSNKKMRRTRAQINEELEKKCNEAKGALLPVFHWMMIPFLPTIVLQ